MTAREAIDFLKAWFVFFDSQRVPGEDYTIQDKMRVAVTAIEKRIIELEVENGKLKLERMVSK